MAAVAIVALAFSLARPPAAQAETPSEFVTTLGENAIGMLVDETMDPGERDRLFRDLMVERFDLPLISRYVLGVQWRRAKPVQKDEYTVLFQEFIVQVYSSRLRNYGGQTFQVKSARAAKKDTIVTTEVRGPATPPVRVDWRVRGEAANYKVVDIIIEGVSMVITQRAEFAAVIRQSGGNMDGLLARLRESTSPAADQQVSQADVDEKKRYNP